MAIESPERGSKDTAVELESSSSCQCSRSLPCFSVVGYVRARLLLMVGHGPKYDNRRPRRQASTLASELDSTGTPVTLHLYDALNFATADSSFPIVHLGVEIFDIEACFGERGVRFAKPGTYNVKAHRDPLLLGHTHVPKRKVYRLLSRLKKEWPGERYRIVGCNCQTFAMELCEQLGLGCCIPAHYTRFAEPFLAPITDIIPAALCQQLGSQSNSGSDGFALSSSSGEDPVLSNMLEILDDAGCGRTGRHCGEVIPDRQASSSMRCASSVSGSSNRNNRSRDSQSQSVRRTL